MKTKARCDAIRHWPMGNQIYAVVAFARLIGTSLMARTFVICPSKRERRS
jgi:hypothetical protein